MNASADSAAAAATEVVFRVEALTKIYVVGEVNITALNGIDLELYGGERELTGYRPDPVGFVRQCYNLIPSLTARENVAIVTEIACRDECRRPVARPRRRPEGGRKPGELHRSVSRSRGDTICRTGVGGLVSAAPA